MAPDGTGVSKDGHDTYEAAEAVCAMLQKEGFGGEGKQFSVRTWVESKGERNLVGNYILVKHDEESTEVVRVFFLEKDFISYVVVPSGKHSDRDCLSFKARYDESNLRQVTVATTKEGILRSFPSAKPLFPWAEEELKPEEANPELTFEEFMEEQRKELENFNTWWRSQQAEDGTDRFPDKMSAGDWDEQYRIWSEGGSFSPIPY